MPVAVVCPACKAKLKAPDNLVGKKVKCPGCAKPVLVPGAGVAASAPTPAPAAKKPVKPAAPPVEEEPLDEVDEQEEPKAKKKPKKEDNEEGATPAPGGPSTDKERGTAMWIHLVPTFLLWCCGIGGAISLFMWLSKRKESPFIDHHGKTCLNLIINVIVAMIGVSILSSVAGYISTWLSAPFGLINFALFVYFEVMSIMTALKAKKGEWAENKVLLKVLK